MRKSFLLGIFILIMAFFGIKGIVTGIKNSGNYSLHRLNMEVKVIDYLSGNEGHANVRVTGNGALIIRKLDVKTAMVYISGADILVIIKETDAQIKFNTENPGRQYLLVNHEREINTVALEQFVLNTHLKLGNKYPGYHEGREALEHAEQE